MLPKLSSLFPAKMKTLVTLFLLELLSFSIYGQTPFNNSKRAGLATTQKIGHASALVPYYGFDEPYGLNTNKFVLFPYVWLAGLSGSIAVEGFDTPIDIGLGDVFSNLDPALSFHFEGSTGNYSVWLDGMYLSLSSDPFTVEDRSLKADFEYVITEIAITYHLGGSKAGFEPFAGGRYTSLNANIVSQAPTPLGASGREDWFDPIIGARLTTNLTRRLPAIVRADIGGFGVGSDLTWGVTAGVGFRLTDSFVLTGAYRLLDVDFEANQGPRHFVYNAQQSGALWGVAILF